MTCDGDGGGGPEGGHARRSRAARRAMSVPPRASSRGPRRRGPARTSITPSRKSMSRAARVVGRQAQLACRRRAASAASSSRPASSSFIALRRSWHPTASRCDSATPGAPRARHRPRRASRVRSSRDRTSRRAITASSDQRARRLDRHPRLEVVASRQPRRPLDDLDVVDREGGLAVGLVERRQLRGREVVGDVGGGAPVQLERLVAAGHRARGPRRPPAPRGTPRPAGRPARSGPTHGSRCCRRGCAPNSAARAWNVRSAGAGTLSYSASRSSWWRKSK